MERDMQIGVFLVDHEKKILSLSSGTLNFTRPDQTVVKWYGGGKLEKNDLIVFLGSDFTGAGLGSPNALGEKIAALSGLHVILCRYGDRDCIPLIKPIERTVLQNDHCFLDVVYAGESVKLCVLNSTVEASINGQSCVAAIVEEAQNLLIIKKKNGIGYFSNRHSGLNEMKAVMEGHQFEPYIDPEEFPVALADFFEESVVQSVSSLKNVNDAAYLQLNGRAAVLRKMEGVLHQNDIALFSIGDENGYSETLKMDVDIYNKLYFDRHMKVMKNELGCEARLKGYGREIEKINRQLDKVCHKNVTIVLTGESGTGKTYLAREIHKNGKRAEGPFVNVNCASIAYNLIESELFGYEEGAFTGARRGGKIGYFELAKGGTLFLDEISELPITLQGKLLEVLQEETFYRVGGTSKISADVRLIVATNRNLEEMVKQGKFREDLYYRINVFPIHLPPLRARVDDLYSIVEDTLPNICERLEIEPLMLTQKAMNKMKKYLWPGNIRELENVLEKAAVMAEGNLIREEDIFLDNPIASNKIAQSLKERLDDYEKEILEHAFEQFQGDRKQMADFLGLSKTNLFDKIHKYGLRERGGDHSHHEYYR